jgi:hypothetical protein
MAAMIYVIKNGVMKPVPGTCTGDYRKFYRFDAVVPLPEYIIEQQRHVPSMEPCSSVRVQFPATEDKSLLTSLQSIAVAAPGETDITKLDYKGMIVIASITITIMPASL